MVDKLNDIVSAEDIQLNMSNEMIYLETLSDDDKAEYLAEYYASLEALEEMKEKYYEEYYQKYLERQLFTYTSTDGKVYDIPKHIVGIDGIGIHANVKDMDGFITYLKKGSTRSGKIFFHKNNKHNLNMQGRNKYFNGIAFYGGMWIQFYEKPYDDGYNLSFVIYPKAFNNTPELEKQVKDVFLNFLDKSNWKIFRLDIDFTIFKDLSTYYFHKKGTQKFEIITRTRYGSDGSINNVELYDNESEVIKEDVETRYIGNRRSAEFYVRLYNKKKQYEMRLKQKNLNHGTNKKIPDIFPYISRLEIEIKKNGLKRWKDCLEKLTLKHPNYWDSDDLTSNEKVKIAGFLADNRLFSIVSQNTRDKFRSKIAALENSDDIIKQLEEKFKISHNHIIETVMDWTGINIDY